MCNVSEIHNNLGGVCTSSASTLRITIVFPTNFDKNVGIFVSNSLCPRANRERPNCVGERRQEHIRLIDEDLLLTMHRAKVPLFMFLPACVGDN